MASDADEIRQVVAELLKAPEMAALLGAMRAAEGEAPPTAAPTAAPPVSSDDKGSGIFRDIDSAVGAAMAAQRELVELPLETRRSIIAAMRRSALDNNESLSSEAVAETGLGNVRDKLAKNELAATRTPGVEDLEPRATTDEHGLTLTEPAPWGVIGAITPVTNPIATIVCNSIGMIAAGNSVVFNTHPNAKGVSGRLVGLLNQAIVGAGGPRNLLTTIGEIGRAHV